MRTVISYLYDQQASHTLNVEVRGAHKTYQPIQIFEGGEEGIKLGYQQAKAVIAALEQACEEIEKAGVVPSGRSEHPGYVLEVRAEKYAQFMPKSDPEKGKNIPGGWVNL